MSIKDDAIWAALDASPYHLNIASREHGPLLDQDVQGFLLIKRNADDTVQYVRRGVDSWEASAWAHWAWRRLCDVQDDESFAPDESLPDEDD